MKPILTALLCFICLAECDGQTTTSNHFGRIEVAFTKEKRPRKIYAKVEIKSGFPGGDTAWIRSIEQAVNQSTGLGRRLKKGTYTVSVKFIVSRDGHFADILCENDPGFGLCEAVLRAVKKSPGYWFPAKQPVEVKELRTTNQGY